MTEDDHQFMHSGVPPEPVTRVGIALVQRDQAFLVGIRDPQTVLGGKHEFPGGKCLEQESPSDCAVRECFEETGLRITPEQLLTWIDHRYDHGRVQLSFFLCQLVPGTPASPRSPFAWIDIDQLATLDFPAANQLALERLENHLSGLQQVDSASPRDGEITPDCSLHPAG